MAALDQRLVGLELQANVTALKAQVDALQVEVDAIDDVTSVWTLTGADNLLPAASAIKTQLTAYSALNASLAKSSNTINDSITVINAAV
jgi:hypothetical protein